MDANSHLTFRLPGWYSAEIVISFKAKKLQHIKLDYILQLQIQYIYVSFGFLGSFIGTFWEKASQTFLHGDSGS